MKNNIFGYLFFVFIIIIMAFAIYKVNYSNENTEEENSLEKTIANISENKGTKMTLGIAEFDTINPIITRNRKVQEIDKLIYESLVNIDSEGRVKENLAIEWETTNNITYIVRLRGGVKWTDGTYFSSNDVQFTINKLKESENSVYSENVRKIREVDIIDNTTLRIILSEAVPFYEYYLNFPILSSNYYGEDDFWNTDKNQKPITTGRFEVSEAGSSTIVLKKNKNWWNIKNNESVIETININLYSTLAELYNAFKLGSIDIIATDNASYQDYIGKIGYNVTEAEGRNYVFLALNTQNAILSDANVRRALKNAINKDEIVSTIYGNSYSKASFPVSSKDYLVDYTDENTFNISEIEKNLKNSGWLFVQKQWRKNINYRTVKIELNMVTKAGTKRVEIARYLKSALADQGIAINIIEVGDEEYQNYLRNRNYDMILCEATQSIAPDLTTYFGSNNLANFSNDEVNEIMRYIDNITDENELKSKYQKLYEINESEVPYIGIARSKLYVITNSYLSAKIDSKWYDLFFNFKDWYTS